MSQAQPLPLVLQAPNTAEAWHALLPEIIEGAGAEFFQRYGASPLIQVSFVDALSVYGIGWWAAFVLVHLDTGDQQLLAHVPLTVQIDSDTWDHLQDRPLARIETKEQTWLLVDATTDKEFRSSLKYFFDPEYQSDFEFSSPIHDKRKGFYISAQNSWMEVRHDILPYAGELASHTSDKAVIGYGPRTTATLFHRPPPLREEATLGTLAYSSALGRVSLVTLE